MKFDALRQRALFCTIYEILDEMDQSSDQIDSTIDFISLQWQQPKTREGLASSGKMFALVPADRLKGMVHVTKVYEYVHSLLESNFS